MTFEKLLEKLRQEETFEDIFNGTIEQKKETCINTSLLIDIGYL